MMKVTREFALRFAEEWIAAWNARDLERILSHYTDDFEMSSPVIVRLMGEPSGALRGKAAVRDYWARALARIPDLHFALIDVYTGASSVVIHYDGPRGASAEVFWFNEAGKVYRAGAHYTARDEG
jgi:ketosteroid isomerase-like protein